LENAAVLAAPEQKLVQPLAIQVFDARAAATLLLIIIPVLVRRRRLAGAGLLLHEDVGQVQVGSHHVPRTGVPSVCMFRGSIKLKAKAWTRPTDPLVNSSSMRALVRLHLFLRRRVPLVEDVKYLTVRVPGNALHGRVSWGLDQRLRADNIPCGRRPALVDDGVGQEDPRGPAAAVALAPEQVVQLVRQSVPGQRHAVR